MGEILLLAMLIGALLMWADKAMANLISGKSKKLTSDDKQFIIRVLSQNIAYGSIDEDAPIANSIIHKLEKQL